MLRLFRDLRPAQAPELSALIWGTLRSGSAAARVALARQRVLSLDNGQIDFGLQASEPEVTAAFSKTWR